MTKEEYEVWAKEVLGLTDDDFIEFFWSRRPEESVNSITLEQYVEAAKNNPAITQALLELQEMWLSARPKKQEVLN